MQRPTLLASDGRRDQHASLRIIVQTLEQISHPRRNRGATTRREANHLGKIGHRQNAGHDRHGNAGFSRPVHKTKEVIDIEKELGDGAAGAGADLSLEVVDVSLRTTRFRVSLRVSGNADLEIGDPFQPGNQIRGVGIASRVRHVPNRSVGRIAAQSNDVPDTSAPVRLSDHVDLASSGANAGQMRRRLQVGFLANTQNGRMSPFSRRSRGPVCNRNVCRIQDC